MIISVFAALACIVILGSLLLYILPDVQVDALRQSINKIVLTIFLPALNFNVIYKAKIGHQFWQLPVLAFSSVLILVAIAMLAYQFIALDKQSKGALIIGCAFSNVTYFGIAVLQGLFPHHLTEVIQVAILFEITITPLSLIVGSALAAFYSETEKFSLRASLLAVAKMPLLWTTFIALGFNFARIPLPDFILRATGILAGTVSGLMIFSLGMALKYPILMRSFRRLHILLPVLIIKLLLSPLLVFIGVKLLNVTSPFSQAAVIEAAMPSQLISLAIVDRFKLNVEILAVAISLDTVVAFVTLPIVHILITHWS